MYRIATAALVAVMLATISPVSAHMGGNDGIEVEAAVARARAGETLSEHDKGLLERYGCSNNDSQFCQRLFGTSRGNVDSKPSRRVRHRHHQNHNSR